MMEFFERSKRTLGTRGITLSGQQMKDFLIKGIFNSCGNPDYLNGNDTEIVLRNYYDMFPDLLTLYN